MSIKYASRYTFSYNFQAIVSIHTICNRHSLPESITLFLSYPTLRVLIFLEVSTLRQIGLQSSMDKVRASRTNDVPVVSLTFYQWILGGPILRTASIMPNHGPTRCYVRLNLYLVSIPSRIEELCKNIKYVYRCCSSLG
jgi:hypothetical protein